MSFEEGDTVKIRRDCSGTVAGEVYALAIRRGPGGNTLFTRKEGDWGCSCQGNWVLVSGDDFRFV